MAGVAGPMLRSNRGGAVRLLAGLLVGEIAAGVLIAVPAFLVGEGLRQVLPAPARLWAVAALCVLFGAADITGRTPRVARQVPEDLIRRLPPGSLGLAWGFDLGLLFTTQKAVSLIWVAIAATVLLDPPVAAVVIIGMAVLAGLVITALSLLRRPGVDRLSTWGLRLRQARFGSGASILALCVLTAVQAWRA
jgi:hypothetical protein